ncbi:tryptophan--tRNA ligase [candidate division WWE3 bacterium RIFOXYC1_FULL_40_10]|uniref:Tryptophan--tRNA ligase n=1 Tax=candidate division WWE3 bacterium RIFOXYA2_FULL_46_9 TaxID=1802636 RepID=A0A1F4W1A7_UNCKA|nr:MAG: tryptophan--tRNA ligase [candidate division WWE3 bacterium RIFOXYB1_FULL_40_22]OGC61299.1 MAG: tryptophan--tRNA ligase [candidate division WWE3 bacterium RIFOXYA1_FULL_40_11]OGC63209.1 MAG: tryptophan--tRNA ligase [candidate division WWE3 bacterium RIFOXYA2_FULL_46_9]OGC65290.1 MAG: tryptophan--tRNA ligase [candidate division WWE3 bacterium RIFOXYB2_FULL_41_6]OGC65682.1 MAG: tryptophan--tRNA ligase [candidate division WWE3 bacterium RIFOXYC1_FULL_40_10]OGC67729.1 MAG: tryptophan--tRNA 
MTKKRILTGDNPTGKLHLGHYVGSLKNRIRLQDEYETFIIIADSHAFAYPKYVASPEIVADGVLQVTMDNLAIGLDPTKVTFFAESGIPEIYELGFLLSMLVSHNRALRNPTLKEEIKDKNMGDNYSLGFVNFPIMQAADILCVNAHLVPVGEDQLPHVELTREVARKFNSTYGEVFVEPEGLVGEVKRLVGTDGNAKMTKSLGNTIFLSETEAELKRKISSMYTDPSRIHPTDPGRVEGNPVFIYHDAFNSNREEVEDLKGRYKTGKVGDVEVKDKLFKVLNELIAPIREKRAYYEAHQDEVKEIIAHGTAKTRAETQKTLNSVLEKIQLR